jgi:SAM-dependent methyltransferase
MGIAKIHINLFCKLKKKDPSLFRNTLLSISQNSILATENEVKKIFIKNNLKAAFVSKKFDKINKIPEWLNTRYSNNINTKYLFSLYGSKKILISDVSRYENPDIIIDLNKNVKRSFYNRFDNIIDMGTLEHIFNIPAALNNYKQILKKNGNIIIATSCSNLIDHGFYSFSPTLFFDFFENNGFKLTNCFLREFNPFNYESGSKIYKYETVGSEIPFISNKSVELIVVAKKIHNQLNYFYPIQRVYLKNDYWLNKSSSTILEYSQKKKNLIKVNSDRKKISKTTVYFFFKGIFIIFMKYLPFYFEKKIFTYVRGKSIKRIY